MDSATILYIALIVSILAGIAFVIYYNDENNVAQRELDAYLSKDHSKEEIGRIYERYIGYLYEINGHLVVYNGALNKYSDMGRDLIVSNEKEIYIIQTKCWAKNKVIHESHIFQLYGSMTHFKLTSENQNKIVRSKFYSTTNFSDVAFDAAKILGVETKLEKLSTDFPMIKCWKRTESERYFYLPFDPNYDKIKINLDRGDFYVRTVKDSLEKGFKRAPKHEQFI